MRFFLGNVNVLHYVDLKVEIEGGRTYFDDIAKKDPSWVFILVV